MARPIYLDANANVPAVPAARRMLAAAADDLATGNPSSPHAIGRGVRQSLDAARDHVAAAVGADPRDVFFTSGASEGNRWVADALPAGVVVVASALEHPSMAKPLAALSAGTSVAVSWPLDMAAVGQADVVVVTAAHNETGIIPDLAAVCAAVKPAAIVVVDAAQAVARLPVLPKRVDAIVVSAHKVGGYAGAGAVVIRGNAKRRLQPPWLGGGQEAGMRPGTEALVLHAAFGAACAVVDETRAAHDALGPLRDRIEAALVEAWGARVLGAGGPRLANTSCLVVTGASGDALRIAIDGAGVCVGYGAACSALVPEPSPSLLALGVAEADARSTIRISLPPGITDADVDDAIARLAALAPVVQRSRSRPRRP